MSITLQEHKRDAHTEDKHVGEIRTQPVSVLEDGSGLRAPANLSQNDLGGSSITWILLHRLTKIEREHWTKDVEPRGERGLMPGLRNNIPDAPRSPEQLPQGFFYIGG